MRKSRLAPLGVALLVGALAFPASSNADPGEHTFTCTFSGSTYNLDDIPGIEASEIDGPGGDLANDIKGIQANPFNPIRTGPSLTDGTGGAPPPNNNRWLIETGGYTFTTAPKFLLPNSCLVVDISHPPSAVHTATTNASGTYKNLLCGTGSTNGSATLILNPLTRPPDVTGITFNYHIDFAAGEGVAVAPPPPASSPGVEALDTGKTTTASIDGTGGGPAAGVGHVHISGSPATNGATACSDSDAEDFRVFGSFVLTQSG